MDLQFFVGHGSPQGWHTQVDAPDTYETLPEKVRAICRWALDHGYDYIFKTDDDTFLNIEILLNYCELADYIGNVRAATGGYPAPYASGYAYWLSAEAMSIIADAALTKDPNEDRWVGNTLAKYRVLPKQDQEHYRIIYPGIENPRLIWDWKSNVGYLAAFGQLPPAQMMKTQKAFTDLYAHYRKVRRPH